MKATKPSDYKHIAAWVRMLRSFQYYVVAQQEKACAANAPIDAVYEQYAKDGSGPTGVWVTASECQTGTQADLNAIIKSFES